MLSAETILILALTAWTIYRLAVNQEDAFFFAAVAVTIIASSVTLFCLFTERSALEISSLSVIAVIFVMQNALIRPLHVTFLFLFVSLTVFVSLLSRQRIFFTDIIRSMRGEVEILDRAIAVLKKSVARLSLVTSICYLLSLVLFGIATEFTYGLATIWSALLLSFLFLLCLLILSLIPK